MERTRRGGRWLALLAAIAAVTATSTVGVHAAPVGQDVTAGACTDIDFVLEQSTTGRHIYATGGTCTEADPFGFSKVRRGDLVQLAGSVPPGNCSGAATSVRADFMSFFPNWTNDYTQLRLEMTELPATGLVVFTLMSHDTPPTFVGGGTFVKNGGDCTGASWSSGTLVYEDPVVDAA